MDGKLSGIKGQDYDNLIVEDTGIKRQDYDNIIIRVTGIGI